MKRWLLTCSVVLTALACGGAPGADPGERPPRRSDAERPAPSPVPGDDPGDRPRQPSPGDEGPDERDDRRPPSGGKPDNGKPADEDRPRDNPSPDDGDANGDGRPDDMPAEGGKPGGMKDQLQLIQIGKDSTGEQRTAYIHVPKTLPATGRKAIMVFHGGSGSNAMALAPNWSSRFNKDAVLVFPNGQMSNSQRGGWAIDKVGERRHLDTIVKLIDQLVASHGVDRKRIWAAGFSSGSSMTWDLACFEGGRFQGFGFVSKYMIEDATALCKSPAKSFAIFAGTQDKDSPYAGFKDQRGTFQMGAEEAAAWYAGKGGCKAQPTSERKLADSADDNTRVTERTWTGCGSIGAARLYKIDGGGHSWPGGRLSKLPNACHDISATDELINFWKAYAGY